MTTEPLSYTRIFDPANPAPQPARRAAGPAATRYGDRREDVPYVYSEQIILAVNVALVAQRPLLVGGPAGSGKSSLAADVARVLGWDRLVHVISSRTQARDLLWTFDSLKRLRDAQATKDVTKARKYIRPGVLWRAFDPASAQAFGAPRADPDKGVVVLLDEIDKADPDAPNDLLVPLGQGQFEVTDLELDQPVVQKRSPLVVITTNGERDLPRAFLRRCVALDLQAPRDTRLVQIATAHFGAQDEALYRTIAGYVEEAAKQTEMTGTQPPSTAEYLDTIAACNALGIRPDSLTEWSELARTALVKWAPREAPE